MSQSSSLSPSELLARYSRLRNVARELNNKIMPTTLRNALQWAGSELGIRRGKTFVLDSEDEMSVVMDCCYYDYLRDGKNVVQRYFARSKKRASPDEITILRAMVSARFSVFSIVDTTQGVGVTLHDTLRNDRRVCRRHQSEQDGVRRWAACGEIDLARRTHHDNRGRATGHGSRHRRNRRHHRQYIPGRSNRPLEIVSRPAIAIQCIGHSSLPPKRVCGPRPVCGAGRTGPARLAQFAAARGTG